MVMKNLRFLFIGAMAGGAFGAKVGIYLGKLLEVPSTSEWLEAGFSYGVLGGMLTAASFMLAFALANLQQQSSAFSSKPVAGA